MRIYFNKVEEFRKERGMSISGLCQLTGISRTTLWAWKKAKQSPTKDNIKKLAKVLKVSLEDISNLKEEIITSDNKLGEIIESWFTLTEINDSRHQEEISRILLSIQNLNNKLNQSVVIIKALLESMQTMFYIKDSSLKYLTANKAFLNNSSLPENFKVLNKTDSMFFSKNEAIKNYEQDKNVLLTGKPLLRIESVIPGTNRKKWGLISKFPVFDTNNKVVGIIGTFIDITERKKAEEKREILEKAINSMGPSLTIYDCQTNKVIFLSADKIEKQTGYPSEKFLGKKGRAFYSKTILHPEDKTIFNKGFDTNHDNKTRTIEFRTINADRSIKWNRAVDSLIKIADKEFIVGITTDITHYKKEEEKLLILEEYLNMQADMIGIIDIEKNKYCFANKQMFLQLNTNKEFLYTEYFTKIMAELFTFYDINFLIKTIRKNEKIEIKSSIKNSCSKQIPIKILFEKKVISCKYYVFQTTSIDSFKD